MAINYPRLKAFKYPKIDTLWKRDKKTHKIIEGDFSRLEFDNIFMWHITEKIHGTNIRVVFERVSDPASAWQTPVVEFKGKTDDGIIPKPLLEYLEKTFIKKQLQKQFVETTKVILFGEGYGKGIQALGRLYRKDNAFVLFDAWIDGWWLEPDKIQVLAKELGIDHVPPIGIMDTLGAVAYVKSQLDRQSKLTKQKLYAEGIVARSHPLMLFRDEDPTPIMFKLKAKDYR